MIWAENEAEYLCKQDWTGQISLIRHEKLDFRRDARRSTTYALSMSATTNRSLSANPENFASARFTNCKRTDASSGAFAGGIPSKGFVARQPAGAASSSLR
jgi:hypothetical protein